jgi:predicted metalloprotease with PDZ domain
MKGVALILVVVVALAAPLAAGEKHSCKASTQDCLNYMKTKMSEKGWVGIEYDPETNTVIRVIEKSPAEAAGFKKGDHMVALNGVELSDENQDKLKQISYEKMTPGNTITYTVERAGMRKKVDVTLGSLPDKVLAQWVGNHMLEAHAEEIKIASKE